MRDVPQEIIQKASNGDKAAFKELYVHIAAMVYAVCLRISHSKEDAEEIAQEVFLKIYSHLNTFEYKSSFSTWVYRITFNTAINFVKQNSKWKKVLSFDDTRSVEPEEFLLAEEESLLKEKKIEELLSLLNPDQRACMILRVIEGLKYQEIADILNINVNTVRTRIIRARRILLTYKKRNMGTF